MLMLPIAISTMPDDDDLSYMEWLYKKYHRLMFMVAWKLSKGRVSVDDVVSDSCLSLINNIHTLRTLGHEKLTAYITVTVKNATINAVNKRKRADDFTIPDKDGLLESVKCSTNIERQIELEDELARVQEAMTQLSHTEQTIMCMKYFEEAHDAKIAEVVGLSAKSIPTYVSRARAHLKAILYTAERGN